MIPPLKCDPRYRSLDLWRGALCLLVVLEHAGVALWQGAGDATGAEGWLRRSLVAALHQFIGSPMFFVISGYCVAASVDAYRRRGGASWGFLARRAWRIVPPYWAALLCLAVVVAGLDATGLGRLHRHGYALEVASLADLNAAQWLGNLTLTETWRSHVFGGGPESQFLRVSWSLCYQEQFYLVIFLAMLIAPRRLYGALACATAGLLAFRVFAWDSGMLSRFGGMFPTLYHEFAVGLAVYWRLNVAGSRLARRGVELGLAALLVVAWVDGFTSTIAASGCGLALIGLRRFDARLAAIGRLGWLRAVGRRSYSVYLIHVPVCMLINGLLVEWGLSGFWARALLVVPASALASVAAGWAFDRWVDAPFQGPPALRLPDLSRAWAWLHQPIHLAPAFALLAHRVAPRSQRVA